MRCTTIELPIDIIKIIAKFCDLRGYKAIRCVCKRLRDELPRKIWHLYVSLNLYRWSNFSYEPIKVVNRYKADPASKKQINIKRDKRWYDLPVPKREQQKIVKRPIARKYKYSNKN